MVERSWRVYFHPKRQILEGRQAVQTFLFCRGWGFWVLGVLALFGAARLGQLVSISSSQALRDRAARRRAASQNPSHTSTGQSPDSQTPDKRYTTAELTVSQSGRGGVQSDAGDFPISRMLGQLHEMQSSTWLLCLDLNAKERGVPLRTIFEKSL